MFFSYFYHEQCLSALHMQLKSTILFLTILFHLLFVPLRSESKTYQENPLTKAIQLFDKEKYTEAEPLFKKLLDQRPDDFMVNYFYGACRTENGHYTEQDLNYLIKASKEVTPLNIDYYFGVQYHAKNRWDKALVYYKLYKEIASSNEQEKANLSQKMDQCANHINPFVSSSENLENKEISEVPAVGFAEVGPVTAAGVAVNAEEKLKVQELVVIDSVNTDIVKEA